MKNLLVGNGLLIQYGGKDYTNKSIILRALENYEKKNFPAHIIIDCPIEAKAFFGYMMLRIPQILNGDYDNYTNCSAEKEALRLFIERYKDKKSLQISDIGFEDYYLVFDLICHKYGIQNPDQFYVRESIKVAFLHSIYNNGDIGKVYYKFSDKLINYLKSFDNIFTTNYDNNIEKATGKNVYHIHGSFYDRSDIYNPESFRNQLGDYPMNDYDIDEKYFYLYSTAISAHCGEYKNSYMEQATLANSAIEKLADAYIEIPYIKDDVDSWENHENNLVARLFDAVKVKISNPNLKFTESYHTKELKEMEGELHIIGLSPYNDFHIFDMINNSNISNINYYYFDESECSSVEKLINLKNINFLKIVDLWEEML